MSKKQQPWLDRRGQTTADTAINQLVELRSNENIQQILDDHIDDSPAQVRERVSDASLEDLVQSMRNAGFSSVLVVRPHPQQPGRFELVFGHRRRAAWRVVCSEQGRACLIPALVRQVSDRDMLLQGATENLAREDLTLREECNLVARLLKEFYPSSQEEIGKMIGKTRGWIAPHARVNGLPEELRDRLWERPSAMSHVLELATLHHSNRDAALSLAGQIVREELTLNAVRTLIKEYEVAANTSQIREATHNLAGTNQIVLSDTITIDEELPTQTVVREHARIVHGRAESGSTLIHNDQEYEITSDEVPDLNSGPVEVIATLDVPEDHVVISEADEPEHQSRSAQGAMMSSEDRERLRKIMETLLCASEETVRPPHTPMFEHVRTAIDRALEVIRQALCEPV